MEIKGQIIMVMGVLVLLAITFTSCAIAMSKIDSDADLTMDLVADEVIEKNPQKI